MSVTPLAQRPIGEQLRFISVVLLVLVPAIGVASLATQLTQSRHLRTLTMSLGPAQDASTSVLLAMTQASKEVELELAGSVADAGLPSSRQVVDEHMAELRARLRWEGLPLERRRTYAGLWAAEQRAADVWFGAADAALAMRDGTLSQQGATKGAADVAFGSFREANRRLDDAVTADRDDAREASLSSLGTETAITVGVGLLSVLLILLAGRLLRASITLPLTRLRRIVHQQGRGQPGALADERVGAVEVRALAHDFNELTHANRILQHEQEQVLTMHRLALDVARAVHSVDDVGRALGLVCSMLGDGMRADRVLLYTIGDEGAVEERAQWHRSDLPDLPPLPPSLARQVGEVNDELRRDATVFAAADFLDPEIQAEERAKRFHRATGARSLLMSPVGVAEEGLGVIAVMMLDQTRRWRRYETQAVQSCAGYAAQAIVQLRLSEMQEVQVRRLVDLDRQKNDFMGTISHELRTPLTSISGYLELLEDGDFGDLSRGQLGALEVIGRNTTRLRGLIEDLLVLNRIETSGLHASLQDVAVGDLVGGVVDMLRPVAAAGDVRLVTPPVDETLCVRVDRAQLERALINLGSNAVKFTPEGGTVTVATHQDGEEAVVTVTDTGIGIPAADVERLSERFFRASNATAKAIPGTGLGLAIVRTIVEGHGGQFGIESREGQGTTACIRLPLPARATVPAGASKPSGANESSGEKESSRSS